MVDSPVRVDEAHMKTRPDELVWGTDWQSRNYQLPVNHVSNLPREAEEANHGCFLGLLMT